MSRTSLTIQQWKKLIQEQSDSQQSVKDFCKSKNLNQSTFYGYRKKLLCAPVSDQFVSLTCEGRADTTNTVEPPLTADMKLTCNHLSLTLSSASVDYVVQLVKALS